MAFGHRFNTLIAAGLSRIPFTAELHLRTIARRVRCTALYLRHGEEGLGRYVNQLSDRIGGAGLDARFSAHPKVQKLVADIDEMAKKGNIRLDSIVVKPVIGSPLAADYRRIYINPHHLDKYSPQELRAFARHELEHVKSNDAIKRVLGGRPLPMEHRADHAAVTQSGEPAAFMSALTRLRDEKIQQIADATAAGDKEAVQSLSNELMRGSPSHPGLLSRIKKATKWADRVASDDAARSAPGRGRC